MAHGRKLSGQKRRSAEVTKKTVQNIRSPQAQKDSANGQNKSDGKRDREQAGLEHQAVLGDSSNPAAKRAKTCGSPPNTWIEQNSLSPEAPTPLDGLSDSHKLTTMSIITSSSIEKKVTKILETLASFSFAAPVARPNVIMIYSKGSSASKMVTVIEIAKREIAQAGGSWYQYNGVEGSKVIQKEKPLGAPNNDGEDAMEVDGNGTAEGDVELEEGTTDFTFETMKIPFERAIESRPKVRVVPLMTIYLSRVRIDSLRRSYGEQTNAAN